VVPGTASKAPPAARARTSPAVPGSPEPRFAAGDAVVYAAHGVGRVVGMETRQVGGGTIELVVVAFDQDRLTVRVPLAKAQAAGLRRLSAAGVMENAFATLKGRARTSRGLWGRRALEYSAKINSGDPVLVAEVVRDLHRNSGDPDCSYSERLVYQTAFDRLTREVAAVECVEQEAAAQKLRRILDAARKRAAA